MSEKQIEFLKASCGNEILVDHEDLDFLSKFSWSISKLGYAVAPMFFGGKWHQLRMHCLIMGMREKPIDHINRNKLDNRKSNLRYCSKGENTHNQPKKKWTAQTGTPYVGVKRMSRTLKVREPKKPFVAYITYDCRRYYLGTFATAEDAAYAYDKKALELYGQYAALNFPDSKERFGHVLRD